MPVFELKSSRDNHTIISLEVDNEEWHLRCRLALQKCFEVGADLTGANLTRAYLTGADLTGADLARADLTGANLTRANLSEADLSEANFSNAYLARANLTGADLTEANLTGAILTGADLTGAQLTGADFTGADLTPMRDDLWAVLSASPREVTVFQRALREGKVNGSLYEGECICLVGWLEEAAGVEHGHHPLLQPNSARPIERFLLNIKDGDTPETNPTSKLVLEWVNQWLINMRAAFRKE